MGNMSYCRFQNTSGDLQDCYHNWDTLEEEDREEKKARTKILELCQRIVDDYGEEEE